MLGLQNCKDRNLLKVFRKWMTKKQLSRKNPHKVFWVFRGLKELFLRIKNFWWAMKKVEFSSAAFGSKQLYVDIGNCTVFLLQKKSIFFSKSFIFYVHNFPILWLKSTYFVGPNWQQENNCSKCSLFIRPFFREIEF